MLERPVDLLLVAGRSFHRRLWTQKDADSCEAKGCAFLRCSIRITKRGFIDCNENMIGMENADINTIIISMCVSRIASVFIITNSHRFKLYTSTRLDS
jgi:hypothetical protein